MKFSKPQHKAKLVKRYKRFLADVLLEDGTEMTVHCANSGAMTACNESGRPVIISDSQNPKRKLQYTWEMIQMGRTWVGVNTATPNQAVAEFIQAGEIPELLGYESLKREVKYGREGKSRIDILLTRGDEACYVEIKNATMRVDDHAAFPDAVTSRGQKHIEELEYIARNGQRAVLFFFVGRNDCERFRPADEIDPTYGKLLRRALNNGVEVLAYQMKFTPKQVQVIRKLPVDL